MPYVFPAEREVLVSRFNRVLAVLIWAATSALSVGLVVSLRDARLLYIVPCALFAVLAWAMLWRPRLTVSEERIELVNVTRTVSIPWDALINVETKYALTLYTPGRQFPVWSAPAPGTLSTLRATRRETKGREGGPTVDGSLRRPGDLLSTESGAAAEVVRRRWTHLQESGAITAGIADATPVAIRWHVATLTALIALTIGSVTALLLA